MVNNEESSCDSVSNCSTDSKSYDQLLIAFKETHDKANRLVVICNKLRSANNLLEPKVKSLEKELHNAKTELVTLELMCLHASIKTCENCKGLENKVEYLLKTLSKFTMGRDNLETILGSQNAVLIKMEYNITLGRRRMLKDYQASLFLLKQSILLSIILNQCIQFPVFIAWSLVILYWFHFLNINKAHALSRKHTGSTQYLSIYYSLTMIFTHL